jgi:peptide/nickel transport system substrate-binding protein
MRTFVVISALLWAFPALADPAPQRGGTLTFAVTLGEPDNYDCQSTSSSSVQTRVGPHYSLLVKIDPSNYPNVTGDLAESWHVSADGLTYRFLLRPDITFHDGSALTTEDVKASFARIMHPPAGVASAWQSLFNDVEAITPIDARSIEFKLKQPNPSMLIYFAAPTACIYSAKKLSEDPDYPQRKVMGSGPFRFVRHDVGSAWVGERFENYFLPGKPYLDGFQALDMKIEASINSMVSGQIATDFRGVTIPQRERIIAARGNASTTGDAEQAGGMMLSFNVRKPPFDDARVRQALNMALDRWTGSRAMERIVTFSGVNALQRSGSPFGRTREQLEALPGFKPDMAANRTEARRLLSEAGQQNLSFVLANRVSFTPLGVFLIDQWRQIGVAVSQEIMDNSRYYAAQRGGTFDAMIIGAPDYVDDPSLQLIRYVSNDLNPNNLSFAIDRKVDALYEKQAHDLDFARRKSLVQELEAYLLDQAYTVPIFWARRYHVMDARFHGYVVTPSTYVGQDLADIWVEQGAAR